MKQHSYLENRYPLNHVSFLYGGKIIPGTNKLLMVAPG